MFSQAATNWLDCSFGIDEVLRRTRSRVLDDIIPSEVTLVSPLRSSWLLSHEEVLAVLSLPTAELIRRAGGWNVGHVTFQSGEHGDGYLSKMTFLRYPAIVDELASRLASEVLRMAVPFEVVVGPAMVGAVLACAVARSLDLPFTIVYRSKTSNTIKFHRDFSPASGSRALSC
jgi:hypothetical protein